MMMRQRWGLRAWYNTNTNINCIAGGSMVVDIEQLSVAERIQLVEDLWDSLAMTPEVVSVTQAQRDELDRRLLAHHENPSEGASWAQVKAGIKQRTES
jgi:putative addiction module component (TIGR02574 family)